tara:strand:- start:75 stop:290 length:216 start_codon:yes stop_codon:yes gene_type:complete
MSLFGQYVFRRSDDSDLDQQVSMFRHRMALSDVSNSDVVMTSYIRFLMTTSRKTKVQKAKALDAEVAQRMD